MDQVTQQNAATAEEVATTSEEMTSQAQTLLEVISNLELEVNGKHKSKRKKNGRENLTGDEEINPITKKGHQYANRDMNDGNGKTQKIAMESVIPMGENGIVEHNTRYGDF